MKYKKKHKIRLTKTGKILFSIIIFIFLSIILFTNSNKETFYLKEENDLYVMEIKYPRINNKMLLADATDYINNKKDEFKENMQNLDYKQVALII